LRNHLNRIFSQDKEAAVTLFTKEGCEKCDYVKKSVDLKKLGVQVEVLSPEDPESLAHLAWHGLVRTAETQLPILVLDDSSAMTGAIRIKNFLASMGEKAPGRKSPHHPPAANP
jgi:glutaredoxin